jgi:tetratricopeptide (TPR) repeat protein
MPPDETECENCGAFVIDEAIVRLCRAFGIPREKALALFEKGFRHPNQLQNKDVDGVLERGEIGLLFLCTNCGGFVTAGDTKCPRCSAEFEAEAEEPATEKDILDIVLCPVCGADNDPAWKECEICGEPLNGTEEPPGGVVTYASESTQGGPYAEQAPAVPAERPPDPHRLQRIDDILEELDEPETPGVKRAVRRIQKVAKRPRAPAGPFSSKGRAAKVTRSAGPRPGLATTTPPPLRPKPRQPIHPIPRPLTKPPATPSSRISGSSARPPRSLRPTQRFGSRIWTPPPSEFTGGIVVAAAGILFACNLLREVDVTWGVAFVLIILSVYVLAGTLSKGNEGTAALDSALLGLAAFVGALAPETPTAIAPALAVAGAVLLAFATRRLLKTAARDLIAVAASPSLIMLAASAAQGSLFASTAAWTFGLLAAVPWPAAVAAEGVWQRHISTTAHHELTRAEQDLERHDYEASVRDYDRAIALGTKGAPGEELPWYGKGASLVLLGRYEEALRAIDMALDLNPRNEVAWLNKGNALTKMGRLFDALRCFNAAIKVNPQYEVAWNNKGNALARLGKYDEALKCYERALDVDPDYRGAWVNKGYVLTKLGRYDEATTCADEALRLNAQASTDTA